MTNLKWSATLLFALIFSNVSGQQNLKSKRIENLISNGVSTAMPFSVYIIAWDTVKNNRPDGIYETDGFSGVIVSAQGHILTAAHAIKANQVYQVTFVDGRKYTALPLGRIGIDEKNAVYDMAMIKITKEEKFDYAQMGSGSEMVLNQPVVSISYPASFLKSTPNVRYGRISNTDTGNGFIQSSAKMEPGDSGGPLFDLKGRLIGIHSRIKEDESQNFDIPVDSFLKYWTPLNKPIDYQKVPLADSLPETINPSLMQPFPSIDSLIGITSKQEKSVAVVMSNDGDQIKKILGTWVRVKNETYLISKSSMVAANPRILVEGKIFEPTVINRDRRNDLILLKPSLKISYGIQLGAKPPKRFGGEDHPGKMLISVLPTQLKKIGVFSGLPVTVPLSNSIGYLDVGAKYQDGKILITEIPQNKAITTKLKRDDHISAVNGKLIVKPEDFINAFTSYYAGDVVKLDIIRNGLPLTVETYLEGQPMLNHASYAYAGGRSERSDGFDHVLISDAAIESGECGSPVFDRSGRFCGINIARHSRTSVLIMPAETIRGFTLQSLKKNY